MNNRGTNQTHQPRHGTHQLVPGGRWRCVASRTNTCGMDHTNPKAAANHRNAVAIQQPTLTWRVEKTYLIPQYSTSDLKRRCWTTTLIRKLLRDPDARLLEDDQHEGMNPRSYYDSYRVHDAELTPAFQTAASKNASRHHTRKQPGQEQPTVTLARSEPVVIDRPETLRELRALAIADMTRSDTFRYAEISHDHVDCPDQEPQDMTQHILQDMVLDDPDAVRHWETDYLHDCRSNMVHEGRNTHRRHVLSARVYDRLAELYPHLADICRKRAEEAHTWDKTKIGRLSLQDLFEIQRPHVGYNLTNLRWSKPRSRKGKIRAWARETPQG